MVKPSAKPKLKEPIEDPNAAHFFADEATGISWHQGVVRIAFSEMRFGLLPGAAVERRVVGRIEMPVAAAEAFAVQLLNSIAAAKAQSEAEKDMGGAMVQ